MNKVFVFLSVLVILASSCKEKGKEDFSYVGWTTDEVVNGDFEKLKKLSNDQLNVSESSFLALGYADYSFWIKLEVNPKFRTAENTSLEISNPMLNEIQIYSSNGVLLKELGRVNFKWNDPKSFFNRFEIPPSDDFTYFIKVNSYGNNNIPIYLIKGNEDGWTIDERNLFFGIYFGIIIAMFIYNMFLWVSTKDNLYGLYIAYIFFVGLTQGILGGYIDAFFFQNNPYLNQNSFYLSTVMVNIVGIFYSLRFLNIKKINPRIYNAGLTIISVYIFILFAFLVDLGIGQLKIRLLQIFLGIVPIFLLSISLYSLRKGYRPAKFFLLSWFLLICSMVIFLLSDLNILPHNFLTNYIFTIGSIFEALLLSFALADKINILKREKEIEQAEKMKVLRENEELIKEQNTMLEEKVRLRTDELEQALRNLQNTQSQLVSQEKMASLGQLTAGIAHEINNPINFVSSNIAPLKRDIKDIMEVIEFYRESGAKEFSTDTKKEAKQLEEDLELDYVLDEVDQLLKGMEDGAKRTVEIVKGLRLFSRVDEQDVKKVDLHDGINSTIILLNSSIPGKIRIVREFGELPMVECLAGKINQVFMNIINNAVHALSDNLDRIADPVITIRTKAFSDHVKIEIEDNGPGMPENVKQRIFEPFFTTKAVGKGTGLGLSIVYSIIENHKGTLEVLTEEGQGTTFIISLPIYQNAPKYE
ncbi:7TM diverse intracellular signaling domain-containing protein [Algoriphagus sp. AK58]|uniref:sensor histidine kinase n=1 Tax=Algoriphagus sp. AK58 TaxID=1406877 RepID=UPI00164F9388|nr:7TM diverse intracellular signaling domain-containing protein [Algoriphagus sp. AK58]MBC6368982.1 phosphate starvation-inducible protein PsiE [Algoriphagus sp. AK58]